MKKSKSLTSYQAQMIVIQGIESHMPLDLIVKKLSTYEFEFNEDPGQKLTLKQWVIKEMANVLFYPEQHDLKLQIPKAA